MPHPDEGVRYPPIRKGQRHVRVAQERWTRMIPVEYPREDGWTIVFNRSHLSDRPRTDALMAVVCSCDPTKVSHVPTKQLTECAIPEWATCGCHRRHPDYDWKLGRLKANKLGPIPTGTQFGDWTVTGPAGGRKAADRNRYYSAKCRCGSEKVVHARSLRRGVSVGCGCRILESGEMEW